MLTLIQTPRPVEAPQIPQTPIAGIPVDPSLLDVGALRVQVRELQLTLTGLQAQWDGLYSQLNNMLRNNPARPGVQQQWADVGVQIAKVKGDIAYREARIALIQGRSTTAPPPGSVFRRPIDPNVAMPLGMVLFLALGLPISIAWARRVIRGRPQPAPLPADYTMRLDNIERAIDAVAIEVERISEGQRFVTKLFAEQASRASAQASPAAAPAQESAPKALGAGPMEPIPVPQRERVRQVITPH